MAVADYCHDDGKDWHSTGAIVEWTCLSRSTVIAARKDLEAAGLIAIERRFGALSVTRVQLDAVREAVANQSAAQTGATGEPVRQPDPTGTGGGPRPVRQPDQPVREPDPKHQQASVKHQEAIPSAADAAAAGATTGGSDLFGEAPG